MNWPALIIWITGIIPCYFVQRYWHLKTSTIYTKADRVIGIVFSVVSWFGFIVIGLVWIKESKWGKKSVKW